MHTERAQDDAPPPVEASQPIGTADDSWLAEAVRSFDLSSATPIDAMMFLNSLKQRLHRQG